MDPAEERPDSFTEGHVRPGVAEAAGRPDYPLMGGRLRAARRARGLSLRELALRLRLSPSLISQIETGRANPSVSTLYAIATELDVSLDELLFGDRRGGPDERMSAPPSADRMLQRSDSRKRIRLASGVEWERLTPLSEPDVEFLHVTYEVGGASSPETSFQRHAGHEWGYVLDGSLEVRIGFEEYVLGPGDAISFDSTIPHRLANVGDRPVHAIWFVLGRTSSQTGPSSSDLHVSANDHEVPVRQLPRRRALPTSVTRPDEPE
jgi:transcriptional regulator with XRE-family HTH domain